MKTAILAATMASFVLLASSWLPADAVVNGTRSDDPSVASATVRFAVIGDFGMGNYSDPALSQPEADVAIQVASWNPDFIVTTGDDNYPDGTAETIDANIGKDYHDFIYPYFGIYGTGADINRFFPTLGNHDWRTVDAEGMPYPYLNFFTLPENGRQELYYHFTWGPVQFFMLDS
jgi:tartrate-resistant acid phosphatase type 5